MATSFLRSVAAAVTAVAAFAAAPASPTAQATRPAARPATRPALVVLIVVDQFRADYVQKYGGRWTKGLRRLVDQGAYFPLAAYPYSYTVTCAGHHTIGTGSFPRTHGMIGNAWYDRDERRSVACTDDKSATSVPLGGRPGKETHGPKRLLTTTFADELRTQSTTPAHVVSLSLKARSAIGMAGHGGDLVMWEEDMGTWTTSSPLGDGTSAAFRAADAWTTAHPIAAQYGRVWDRLLPASAYAFDDAGLGEPTSGGLPNVFPYPQTRPSGQPDQGFYDNWERTPFVDEMLTDMALELMKPLGKGPGTDMLAVSYSALDLVGHRWGPTSHEVQDVLLRLDVQLGRLFDALDRGVGAGNYVVGLSADHGAAPLPEQVAAKGIDAGRFSSSQITRRVTEAWQAAANSTENPLLSGGSDLYFTPAALARIRGDRRVRDAVIDAALSVEGVGRAFWGDDLAAADAGDDAVKRAAILSYVAGRSADLIVIPKQYWLATSSGTTHGTPWAYDQRVPVMLMGFHVKPGHYLTTVTPADLAPTFAFLAGVTLPRAEGRVLGEALR